MKIKKDIPRSELQKLIKGTNYEEVLIDLINGDDAQLSLIYFLNEVEIALPKMVNDGIIDERFVVGDN